MLLHNKVLWEQTAKSPSNTATHLRGIEDSAFLPICYTFSYWLLKICNLEVPSDGENRKT